MNPCSVDLSVLEPQPHQHQQLPQMALQQQQHGEAQLNPFKYPAAMYTGNHGFDGWPGMDLKQIINLTNFHSPHQANTASMWHLNKDFMNNKNGNQECTTGNSKSIGFDCAGQLDHDTSQAWLGPQLWNRRIGVEMSDDSGQKIKTETASDISKWCDDVINNDQVSSIETSPTEMSPKSCTNEADFCASDLALASAPGTNFDPRTRCFSSEELKPQPIIRKRRKVYIPEASKDEEYWSRRVKNNVAARRSREARRLKENQIALRAAYLERENSALRNAVRIIKTENEEIQKSATKLAEKIESLKNT